MHVNLSWDAVSVWGRGWLILIGLLGQGVRWV